MDWVEEDCLDAAVAANGLVFRPDRLTCRGLRALPVNEGYMAAVVEYCFEGSGGRLFKVA